MTTEEIRALAIARRAKLGLNVKLDDDNILSFATVESRDEFVARAKRLGRKVEIVTKQAAS